MIYISAAETETSEPVPPFCPFQTTGVLETKVREPRPLELAQSMAPGVYQEPVMLRPPCDGALCKMWHTEKEECSLKLIPDLLSQLLAAVGQSR